MPLFVFVRRFRTMSSGSAHMQEQLEELVPTCSYIIRPEDACVGAYERSALLLRLRRHPASRLAGYQGYDSAAAALEAYQSEPSLKNAS
ncbi:hypothetical protein VTK26DRAFT_1251 [Humicola hyalothermophila]